MKKVSSLFRYLSVPFAAAVVFAVGCVDQESAPLVGPNAPDFAKSSGQGWGSGGKKASNPGPEVIGKAADGSTKSWRLATGTVPNGHETKADSLIGPEGGYLFLQGHVLVVPKGAVDAPTQFKMQPFTGSTVDEVPVAVALKATRTLPSGEVIDVGEQGFNVPVYLALSYQWADETYELGLTGATIVWVKEPGVAEEVQTRTVDYNGKWIVAELNHFSDYGLAWPARTTYSRY
jgi:hypothetical protein